MHVGHLRTTLIGDSLARLLGFLGHDVRRENHIGDWGTPFGMLIEHLLDVDGAENAESFSVRDLNEFYASARRQFDSDPDFAERCRRRVVLLQSGDDETLHLWRIFVAESMRHAREVYDLLGVLLTAADTVGESFYNPLLPVVVSELDEKGLLVENDGALCVFPDGFENRARRAAARSSCASPTAATATPPPTWLPCATAPAASAPPASSTWWRPSRPSTSAWCSPRPSWRATSRRASRPSTSPSASSSGPTGRRWRAGPASPSASSTSCRRASSGPRPP